MYDIAIFGATFAGAGILKAYKGKCVVIEKNTLCGYEFINALKKGVNTEEKPVTEEGKAFYKEIRNKSVLEFSMPLHRIFENKNIKLATMVSDIEKTEEGFLIRLFNNGGFEEIRAKKIVDTICHSDMIISKTLNALVQTDKELEESGINGRKIFKCQLDSADDFITARLKLKKELEKGMMADYIASEFDVCTEENILKKGEITYLTSVSYKNPYLAFDAGCKLAKEGF